MPYRTCPECRNGLRGVEGHLAVVFESYEPPSPDEAARPCFRCSACGTLWSRTYEGDGQFQWRPVLQLGAFRS